MTAETVTQDQPLGLGPLVAWLVRGWSEDLPSNSVSESEQGRSSTPRYDPYYYAILTLKPFAIDEDGYYIRPMNAALHRLKGSSNDLRRDSVWMYAFLKRIACSGGDWQTVCEQVGMPPQVWRTYTVAACRRLYQTWSAAP